MIYVLPFFPYKHIPGGGFRPYGPPGLLFVGVNFLYMLSYKEQLQHPNWQRKRLEILNRDGFKCTLCGDNETMLQIHHKSYSNGMAWEIDNNELITLCEHCHKLVEWLRFNGVDDDINGIFKLIGCDMVLFIVRSIKKDNVSIEFYQSHIDSLGNFNKIDNIRMSLSILQNALKHLKV